jgi:hypothetical protein
MCEIGNGVILLPRIEVVNKKGPVDIRLPRYHSKGASNSETTVYQYQV